MSSDETERHDEPPADAPQPAQPPASPPAPPPPPAEQPQDEASTQASPPEAAAERAPPSDTLQAPVGHAALGRDVTPEHTQATGTEIRGQDGPPLHQGRYAGFPVTKFHPVHGDRVIEDPRELTELDGDWFDTAGEADMHRTETEAVQATYKTMHDKHRAHEEAQRQVVRNSVQAELSKRQTDAEPL